MLVKEKESPPPPPHHQMKIPRLLLLLLLAVACDSFVTQPARRSIESPLYSSTEPTATLSHVLSSALKKPSTTLAVAIEYSPSTDDTATDGDLSTLSMQLRKIAASAALVTSDLHAAKVFVEEQATAQGNFPGPCPVIYNGEENNVKEAIAQAGVNAVVVDANNNNDQSIDNDGVDIIYKVSSPEDVMQVVDDLNDESECAFMVDANNKEYSEEILNAIPSGSVVICSLQSMQPDNDELDRGKELKALGATAVLLERACIGDGEDVEYSTFAISGLTKKKSSTFNMSGLTGSTNGHFGGVASSATTSWLRVKE